jgi:hypothetical protein
LANEFRKAPASFPQSVASVRAIIPQTTFLKIAFVIAPI